MVHWLGPDPAWMETNRLGVLETLPGLSLGELPHYCIRTSDMHTIWTAISQKYYDFWVWWYNVGHTDSQDDLWGQPTNIENKFEAAAQLQQSRSYGSENSRENVFCHGSCSHPYYYWSQKQRSSAFFEALVSACPSPSTCSRIVFLATWSNNVLAE